MSKYRRNCLIISIVCFVIAGLCIFGIVGEAGAADYRVYTETGGMNVTENGISEGHKSYHSLGVEGLWRPNKWSDIKGGIEGFVLGEPAEEDPEIFCAGGGAFFEWALPSEWMSPYLGVRYDHFSRSTAWKYNNPDDPEYDAEYAGQQETEHDIVSARGGFHIKHGWFWADVGTIIPFYTNTKSGNFGPDLGVGFRWKKLDVGYRFKEYRMTDHHFQGGEDLSFYFSGVQLGYTF